MNQRITTLINTSSLARYLPHQKGGTSIVPVRFARLAFLGQISEIWPRLQLVGLKNFSWHFGLFGVISSWLALKNVFGLLALFWPFLR